MMGDFDPALDLPIVGLLYALCGIVAMRLIGRYELPPEISLIKAYVRLVICMTLVFALAAFFCFAFNVSFWKAHLVVGLLILAMCAGEGIGLFGLPFVAILGAMQEYILGFPRLIQRPPCDTNSEEPDLANLIGEVGSTITQLKPLGKIELREETYDAESESGEFIDKGISAVVLATKAGRLLVRSEYQQT